MASYRFGARVLRANMVNTNVSPLLEQSLNGHLHIEPGCSVLLLEYWNPACSMCITSVPVSGRALMETVVRLGDMANIANMNAPRLAS